jgi:hypothetical protein
MDKIQSVERVVFPFDSPEHMNAADLACVTLDRCGRIDNGEFIAMLGYTDLVTGHDGDNGKSRTFGLPAFGATARVIVSNLTSDLYLDRSAAAFADERPACKTLRPRPYAIVNRRVNPNIAWHCFPPFLPLFCGIRSLMWII